MSASRGETARLGVIADTHGLLRAEALEALQDSDLILHAGDIGGEAIPGELAAIAPVRAVRGNVDTAAWAARYPRSDLIEVAGVLIYLHHGHEPLDLEPASAGIGVVISGHSHEPRSELRRGVLHLNPGSAGPRRFKLPVTVARLDIVNGKPGARILELAV